MVVGFRALNLSLPTSPAGGTASAAPSPPNRPNPLNMSTSNNTHANSVTSATSTSNHPQPSNSRRSSGSATGGGGAGAGGASGASSGSTPTQACAACKYQRRRCNPDCTLAPYFPADHQRQFLNAHRLFGVSNILKTLRGLDPSQRPAAMSTIIYQSNMRAQDPVGGCYRFILELQRQIDRDSAELELVLRQLAICRAQAQQAQMQAQQQPQQVVLPELNIGPTINLIDQNEDPTGDDVVVVPTLQQQQQQQQEQQQQQQYLYYYFGGGEGGGGTTTANDNNIIITDHSAEVEPPARSPLMSSGGGAVQHARPQCEDDDVKPLVELFDVRHHQTFLAASEEEDGAKGVSPLDYCSNMARMEMKEEPNSMDQQEHDLKSAASLFKLTNCDMSGV